jgi:hypothetical protein
MLVIGGGADPCGGLLRAGKLHVALHRLRAVGLCRRSGDLERLAQLAHAADGVTNAISSIIILGALMQIGSGNWLVVILAALSVFMAGINIFGGFMVTRRMLAMFQKS